MMHVWRYDTVKDIWTSMLQLPVNRSAGALVRVGRKLHFFGGLSYDETAEAVGVSVATVDRELRMAKAWLRHELTTRGGAAKD